MKLTMSPMPGDTTEVIRSVTGNGGDFSPLDELLWQERRLLERLDYRLLAQHAVIASGDTRWLKRSDADVRTAVADLHRHEVLRAAETERLLRSLRRPSNTSLTELAAAAPMPWTIMLDDHRVAMRELANEIRSTAARTVTLLEEFQDEDDA